MKYIQQKALIMVAIIFFAALLIFFFVTRQKFIPKITNYNECVQSGGIILETYPTQCRTKDGRIYIEEIGNELEKIDLIRINSPRPNQIISSPLIVEGEARGSWFFEGSFPVELQDDKGNTIALKPTDISTNWMTDDFVPFHVIIEFNQPTSTTGMLILHKDNPSGLQELDDALIIPIKFR